MPLTAEAQLASAVMMIRPARFESNPNTLESNKFQGKTEGNSSDATCGGARRV